MEQYIKKSDLVAEIERIDKSIDCDRFLSEFEKGRNLGKEEVCNALLYFLNTIEVKEVDLEKDFELTWEDVAWIVNKAILKCKDESTLTAEDICKDVLKQFKDYKGE